jgi:hypothetical protein
VSRPKAVAGRVTVALRTVCGKKEVDVEEHTELLKEFMAARSKYRDLYKRLIDLGRAGVIDPADLLAAGCNAGDKCHGGDGDIAIDKIDQVINPERRQGRAAK